MAKFLFNTLFLIIFFVSTAYSQHRILLDEDVSDWDAVQTGWTSGSSTAGISMNTFKVTNDGKFLFIYFKSDNTYSLQNTDGVKLYVDSDNNSATGFDKNGIGAEIVFNFGQRRGTAYLNNSQYDISFSDLFMVTTPTIDSDYFEVAISRNAVINNIDVFNSNSDIKLILSDESVSNGSVTNIVNYTFANSSLDPLPYYSFTKKSADHLRIISHNVEFDSFFEEAKKPAYERLYNVINPDIIGFSEIYNHSGADVANRLEEMLPSPTGKNWRTANIQDNFVATRYTIKNSWAAGGFGNGIFLLDLRPDFNTDALVVVAHPPCCNNDANRQTEVDAIMSFIREAKEPGGELALNDSTPILIIGDMNFVGAEQQVTTMLTGDILNEATYGNDFTPDWDGSDFLDAKPLVTELPMTFTQGTGQNPGSFSKGRLDYIIYSGSVLDLQNSFVLYTNSLSEEQLQANNLLSNDTETASDHFPAVSDFLVTATGSGSEPQTTLSSLRMNNSEGRPEMLGTVVTVSGTVTVGQEFGNAGPANIQGENAGMAIYGENLVSGLTIGDQITITSPVGFYNGLTELVYDSGSSTVTVNNGGNNVTPFEATIDDILNQSWNGFEEYEGALVEIKNITIDASGTLASNTNYSISDGQNSMTLRVDDAVDLSGVEITDETYTIVGVISQFDNSSPYSEGYLIYPRFADDIKKQTISSDPVIGELRVNNENGVPELLDEIVTASGVVTANAEFGASGPRYIQDHTGGLAIFGSAFENEFNTGDSVRITSKLSHYNGLTQLIYDANTTVIEIVESNITVQPKTIAIEDILNQTWNGLEEYEGILVTIENATIAETGSFDGNSNYTLTDETGSTVLRVDNDVNLVGQDIPNGTFSVTGIVSQFDFSSPYSEGYQILPRKISDIKMAEETKSISKENLLLYYNDTDEAKAASLAVILQDKLDYLKRYTRSGFYDNEKSFTLYYCTDHAEFNDHKPADTEDFESSYFADGDMIYFMEPTTSEQLNFAESIEQASMFGLARGIIRNEYQTIPLEEWLEYGFASVQAGLNPTSDFLKQQVQSLGRTPKINELNDWDGISDFNKYAFAHTAAEFIGRKFLFSGISYTIHFNSNNTTSYNLWSIKNEEKFDEVWNKYLDLFYLNEVNLMTLQRSSDNFLVYSADVDASYAEEYNDLLEETVTQFSEQLDLTLPQKTSVFIYPSLCDYHNSVGIDFCNPNSIGGGVGIDMFQMVTPRDIDRPTEKMHALAMHEFAHVVQFNIYPAFLPPWLSEGFASFMPGGILSEDEITAIQPQLNQEFNNMFNATGSYPTVEDLSDRNTIDQYGLDYYLLGQVMVDFIVRKHGYISLKEFVKDGGTDFSKLGYTDTEDFENTWFAFYEETYSVENTVKSMTAKKAPAAMTIDGNITEEAWNLSEALEKDVIGTHNNTAMFGVLWDSDYLYVAVNVIDDALFNDGGPGYENDGIEVFIDADFNKGTTYDSFDRQFTKSYSSGGIDESNGNTDGVIHAAKNITGGYSVEIAIPWTNLNISATQNTTIGFDIANNDDDDGDSRESQVVWSGIADNWRNTQYFGEVTLSEELATYTDDFNVEVVPDDYKLYQNFPNPFNPVTIISYATPENGHVSLKVYDLLGKSISTLVHGVKSAGNHTVTFDAGNLNSGVYIYVLETEHFRSARKLLLIK
jgi:hypothetical protein